MKKITAILITFFLISTYTVSAHGSSFNRPNRKPPRHSEHPGVGAPLDGGLLTILGAAGIAYYVSRKKKRNPEA